MASDDRGPRRVYRVLCGGEPGVGKTSVVRRLTNNYFPKTDPSAKQDQSVGISYQFKKMRLKGETILLQVWDAERVDSEIVGDMSSTDHHLSRVRGAAIILDVMQLKHLDKYLRKRVEAIKEQNGANDATEMCIVLLVNKTDLVEKIHKADMKHLDKAVKEFQLCGWFEVSALDGTNVDVAYQHLAIRMMDADDYTTMEPSEQCNVLPGTGGAAWEFCACS